MRLTIPTASPNNSSPKKWQQHAAYGVPAGPTCTRVPSTVRNAAGQRPRARDAGAQQGRAVPLSDLHAPPSLLPGPPLVTAAGAGPAAGPAAGPGRASGGALTAAPVPECVHHGRGAAQHRGGGAFRPGSRSCVRVSLRPQPRCCRGSSAPQPAVGDVAGSRRPPISEDERGTPTATLQAASLTP
jgi:hypothetical protein